MTLAVLLVLSFISARKAARWFDSFEFKSRKSEDIFYFKKLSNYFVLADQVGVPD